MNKQEVIEKIEKEKSNLNAWEDLTRNRALDDALAIIRKLDEPVKPIVPQFVAEWYEDNKDAFEYNLYLYQMSIYDEKVEKDNFYYWMQKSNNPVHTLVNMHQFGYEIEKEKEKLYRVELPNPNGDSNMYGLCKVDGRIIIGTFVFGLNKASNAKLTEAEIKQDFDWAWQFAKEVEEND